MCKLKLFCFAREFCFSLLCEDASSYSSFHPLCKLSSLLSDNLESKSARDCLERGYTTIQQASLAIIVLWTTAFLCPVKRARVVLKKNNPRATCWSKRIVRVVSDSRPPTGIQEKVICRANEKQPREMLIGRTPDFSRPFFAFFNTTSEESSLAGPLDARFLYQPISLKQFLRFHLHWT